jgi:hypothetical protein
MDDSVFSFIIIGVVVGFLATYCSGYRKGMEEQYQLTKAALSEAYEAEISELQEKIRTAKENYDNEFLALQRRHNIEINSLQKKQSAEIVTFQQNHASEIDKLKEKNHENLIQTRDSSYVAGQKDSRDAVQNEIDSNARRNMEKNDWNAPVYSLRK